MCGFKIVFPIQGTRDQISYFKLYFWLQDRSPLIIQSHRNVATSNLCLLRKVTDWSIQCYRAYYDSLVRVFSSKLSLSDLSLTSLWVSSLDVRATVLFVVLSVKIATRAHIVWIKYHSRYLSKHDFKINIRLRGIILSPKNKNRIVLDVVTCHNLSSNKSPRLHINL